MQVRRATALTTRWAGELHTSGPSWPVEATPHTPHHSMFHDARYPPKYYVMCGSHLMQILRFVLRVLAVRSYVLVKLQHTNDLIVLF
jgi:hypothetical protein